MINIAFNVEFKRKSKSVMLEYGSWFNGDLVNPIEWLSIEYRLYSGVALSLPSLCDWSRKKNLPPFQPIRCKTKTNCNSATPIFQRLRQLALFHFKFPLVSVTFVCCNGNVIFRIKRIGFVKVWFSPIPSCIGWVRYMCVARTRIDRYRLY